MQQVHFCSGAVFVTGDEIAISLLRYVRAVAIAHQSDVITIPTLMRSGHAGTVTLVLNDVTQISSESYEHTGPELKDAALVARLTASTHDLATSAVWLGDDDPVAA